MFTATLGLAGTLIVDAGLVNTRTAHATTAVGAAGLAGAVRHAHARATLTRIAGRTPAAALTATAVRSALFAAALGLADTLVVDAGVLVETRRAHATAAVGAAGFPAAVRDTHAGRALARIAGRTPAAALTATAVRAALFSAARRQAEALAFKTLFLTDTDPAIAAAAIRSTLLFVAVRGAHAHGVVAGCSALASATGAPAPVRTTLLAVALLLAGAGAVLAAEVAEAPPTGTAAAVVAADLGGAVGEADALALRARKSRGTAAAAGTAAAVAAADFARAVRDAEALPLGADRAARTFAAGAAAAIAPAGLALTIRLADALPFDADPIAGTGAARTAAPIITTPLEVTRRHGWVEGGAVVDVEHAVPVVVLVEAIDRCVLIEVGKTLVVRSIAILVASATDLLGRLRCVARKEARGGLTDLISGAGTECIRDATLARFPVVLGQASARAGDGRADGLPSRTWGTHEALGAGRAIAQGEAAQLAVELSAACKTVVVALGVRGAGGTLIEGKRYAEKCEVGVAWLYALALPAPGAVIDADLGAHRGAAALYAPRASAVVVACAGAPEGASGAFTCPARARSVDGRRCIDQARTGGQVVSEDEVVNSAAGGVPLSVGNSARRGRCIAAATDE